MLKTQDSLSNWSKSLVTNPKLSSTNKAYHRYSWVALSTSRKSNNKKERQKTCWHVNFVFCCLNDRCLFSRREKAELVLIFLTACSFAFSVAVCLFKALWVQLFYCCHGHFFFMTLLSHRNNYYLLPRTHTNWRTRVFGAYLIANENWRCK